jgi:hypothetical protein
MIQPAEHDHADQDVVGSHLSQHPQRAEHPSAAAVSRGRVRAREIGVDVTVSLAAQGARRAAAHVKPGFELAAWVVPPREIHPPVALLDDPRPLGRRPDWL